MVIYTRQGDEGKTNLINKRVEKNNTTVEAIGELDELASFLAYVYEHIKDERIKREIKRIHYVMANLAGSETNNSWKDITQQLEQEIDEMSKELPPLKGFIIETGSIEGALIHIARAICRRVERRIVELSKKQSINKEILAYINRLSDWLFIYARYVNNTKGHEEYL